MSIAQTILRFLRLGQARQHVSGNLILNPTLESIMGKEDPSAFTTGFWRTFMHAPGWFDFGPESAGLIEKTGSQDHNPFKSGNIANPTTIGGVRIVQNQNRYKGACQALVKAASIRGRKIRVSGVYHVNTQDGNGVSGISVWLKSDKVSATRTNEWEARTIDGTLGIGSRYTYLPTGVSSVSQENRYHHIISMASGHVAFGAGEELFNRVFDWWDDDGSRVAPSPSNETYLIFGGGGLANPASADQDVTIWGLDGNFSHGSGDGTSGQLRLYTETTGTVNTPQYFETYIDVPDEDALFEDNECWVCVFPVDPDDVGASGMGGLSKIVLWGLSIQVVLDDEIDDPITSILTAPSQFPLHEPVGIPLRYLLRYPAYRVHLYPLILRPGFVGENLGIGNILTGQVDGIVDFRTDLGVLQLDSDGTNEVRWLFPQHPLPPGSVLLEASFGIEQTNGTGTLGASIYHEVGFSPNNVHFPNPSRRRDEIGSYGSGGFISDGSAHEEVAAVSTVGVSSGTNSIQRHRIGQWWPFETTGAAQPIDSHGPMSTGFIEVEFLHADGVADWSWNVSGNYLKVLVDPRWSHSMWSEGG